MRCYLVCYDIRNPRRLRQVHKTMKGFGEPWQYSVFYCVLKDIERVRMEAALREVANLSIDQILILDLGPRDDVAREHLVTLGPKLPETPGGIVVI